MAAKKDPPPAAHTSEITDCDVEHLFEIFLEARYGRLTDEGARLVFMCGAPLMEELLALRRYVREVLENGALPPEISGPNVLQIDFGGGAS